MAAPGGRQLLRRSNLQLRSGFVRVTTKITKYTKETLASWWAWCAWWFHF